MLHVSQYGRGVTLHTRLEGPRYDAGEYGFVPAIDHVTIYHEGVQEVDVFAVNRSDEPIAFAFHALDFAGEPRLIEHIVMDGSLDVRNTLEQLLSCIPRSMQESQENDGSCVRLNPYSWNVLGYSV